MRHRPRLPALLPRALAVALSTLGAACGDGGAPAGRSLEGPALATRSDRAEFGDLWEGESRRHTFELESVGSEPIVIAERLDSCGCTSLEWYEVDAAGERRPYATGEPIEPGHRLVLEVLFDSTGRDGHFDQPITLYPAAASVERIPLHLVATIRPLLAVEALEGVATGPEAVLAAAAQRRAGNSNADAGRFVDLGTVRLGTTASATATLRSNAGPLALEVLERGLPPGVVARVEPFDGAREPAANTSGRSERWKLFIELDPGAQPGPRLGTLTLASDLHAPDGSPITARVHVQALVRGLVEVAGGRVGFQALDAGATASRTVGVVAREELELPEDPAVEVVAVLDGPHAEQDVSHWFEAHWTREGAGRAQVEIRLGPLPPEQFGVFEGEVRIALDLAAQPVLTVPFVGTATGLASPSTSPAGPESPRR